MAFEGTLLQREKHCQCCGTLIYEYSAKCRFCGEEQTDHDYLGLNIGFLIFRKALWIVMGFIMVHIAYSFLNRDFEEVENGINGIDNLIGTFVPIIILFTILVTIPKVSSFFVNKVPSPETIQSYRYQKKWFKRTRLLSIVVPVILIGIFIFLNQHKPNLHDFQEFVEVNVNIDHKQDSAQQLKEHGLYRIYGIEKEEGGIYYLGVWNMFFEIPSSYVW